MSKLIFVNKKLGRRQFTRKKSPYLKFSILNGRYELDKKIFIFLSFSI